MTREQIENAAVTMKESQNYHMSFEDAQDYINKCGFDIPWNDGDVFVDEREIVRTVGNVLKWRINSVWHDARKDVPKEFIPILVERDDFTFSVNMVGGNMTSCPLHWVHWAYVIDLLPERKEETE